MSQNFCPRPTSPPPFTVNTRLTLLVPNPHTEVRAGVTVRNADHSDPRCLDKIVFDDPGGEKEMGVNGT